MLQGEHSAILLTSIKLPFDIKIFVLSVFEWPLKTGFTVLIIPANSQGSDKPAHIHSLARALASRIHKIW